MSFHIALSLQKKYQGGKSGRTRKENPKKKLVMIFDNEYREERRFTDLILNPPNWSDEYYKKQPNQKKLNQIIDVPHFVDSQQVGLIQLADFVCFFIRKHIELQIGYIDPSYENEKEKVSDWFQKITESCIPISNIFPRRGRCDAEELFYKYAPGCLKTNDTY